MRREELKVHTMAFHACYEAKREHNDAAGSLVSRCLVQGGITITGDSGSSLTHATRRCPYNN